MCALFGSSRDITTFKFITREVVENIISQAIGYYKIILTDTLVNTYGEALNKTYIGPVLINCLIQRGDFEFTQTDFGPDNTRAVEFRFFKDHLIQANVFPEVGDVIMYNELYFSVDSVNENQLILGKDNQYAYQDGLENFGSSYSIILKTHYASPDSLGIKQERL
jgi:hypothetical protein